MFNRNFVKVIYISIDDLKQERDEMHEFQYGDVAYIIFTSGTTGEPKGVEIYQKSIINLAFAMKARFIADTKQSFTDMKIAVISDTVFDASCGNVFLSLLSGNTLYVISDATKGSFSELSSYLNRNNIDLIEFTPTYLSMYLNYEKYYNVPIYIPEKLISCGEPLPIELVHDVYKSASRKNVREI